MSLILKIILLELTLTLSAPAADKTQYFFYLISNSSLQLVNGISNGIEIVAFLKIPCALSALVILNYLLFSRKIKICYY